MITTNETTATIRSGLKSLGIKGAVKLYTHDAYTIRVYVNDKSFGLWDISKATFVA